MRLGRICNPTATSISICNAKEFLINQIITTMQTLIIILIVVMIINEIIAIGVYFKSNLDKQQYLSLQETVKNTQADFIAQKQRYEKIIDDYKELIRNLNYKCDTQAIRIKGLEQDRTLIINEAFKGTDTDGGVKGEMGEEGKV